MAKLQKIPYTFQRNQTYYLQVCVPASRTTFRKSLLTQTRKEALQMMSALTPTIYLVKKGLAPLQQLSALVDTLTNPFLTLNTLSLKQMNGDVSLTATTPAATVPHSPIISNVVPSPVAPAEKGPYLSLADSWEDYKEFRKSENGEWSKATASANEQYFSVLLHVLGPDANVYKIKRTDIRSVMSIVKGLPKRNIQPYRPMTLDQIINSDDIEEADLIGNEAIAKHFKIYDQVFKYLTIEREVFARSPTEKMKIAKSNNRFGNYSPEDMKKFVEYARTQAKPNWLKWVILLLAYTGARRAEIATLTKEQIKYDKGLQRHYIQLTKGKTVNAPRDIPIHAHLIEWGFLDFVASTEGELFPEVSSTNMAKIGDQIIAIRDDLNIAETDEKGNRRVAHSMRHTAITAFDGYAINDSHIQQIVGHSKSGGITKRYKHDLPLSVVSYIIDGLDWTK